MNDGGGRRCAATMASGGGLEPVVKEGVPLSVSDVIVSATAPRGVETTWTGRVMHPFAAYLTQLRDVRLSGGGVAETSYYGGLAALLDEAGKGLRPKVRCIVNLRNTGAGIPDGGFFTRDQFPRASASEPADGQIPSRGALEVKGIDEDVLEVAAGAQVAKYAARYGQVLVTNLRDFALVAPDAAGQVRVLEVFRSAPDREGFLGMLRNPRQAAEERGDAALEYLRRALLRPAPLADPKDLAWFLASYAKEARERVEAVDLPALTTLRESLEASLGIRFEGARGDHFFRSTLVQTLFYGVFSAWVLWSRQGTRGRFNWHEAAWNLRVPMIRALFHQVADPDRLQKLDLVEVLDWAAEALNRVDRTAFFARFQEDHAVQYFYEPFLEAFDPELRKQLGVWYTPPEVVKYMVAKVDHALRTELDLPDGLADPRVVVLDPCCGTGAYLVEVLHCIGRTLRMRGDDGLIASDLKKAAMDRIFGFDIMPAPFVVAHLQLGLLLQHMGVPFSEEERAGVYLTNALTGWVPPEDPKDQIPIALPEFAAERDQAEHVKRDEPILVVLGNPPYSGYAGMAIGEERDLTEAYRTANNAPQPQGQGLNDLYVRFFRMAERKITEMSPQTGMVCFISNYSWLDGLSFTGMRESYLERFDVIDVDSLNGDKYRTGKTTPDGQPDPSVFSTTYNREGIQVGTAVVTLVRRGAHRPARNVRYRDLWGSTKLPALAADAGCIADVAYGDVAPQAQLGYPFMPRATAARYLAWPRITELLPVSFPGVKTSRDDFLVDMDRERLEERVAWYLDPAVEDAEIRTRYPKLITKADPFDGPAVRRHLLATRGAGGRIVRYAYRPFDLRWLCWQPDTNLLDRNRAEYLPHVVAGNVWVEARQRQPKDRFDRGYVLTTLGDNFGNGLSSFFPLRLRRDEGPAGLFSASSEDPRDSQGEATFNLSDLAVQYLSKVGTVSADAPHLFHHIIAILHAPAYRTENEGALRQDWPRVPLPETRDDLLRSAALGRQLAALLNPEVAVPGVTTGTIRGELRAVASIRRRDGGQLHAGAGDLDITAGWGYEGAGRATMPGRGRAEERPYTEEERDLMAAGAAALGIPEAEVLARLGDSAIDVHLNERAFWRCVPSRVWTYTLGGYQVIKKWLSYREKDLLGRGLRPDEARDVTNIARRISAILLLESKLDANYRRCSDKG